MRYQGGRDEANKKKGRIEGINYMQACIDAKDEIITKQKDTLDSFELVFTDFRNDATKHTEALKRVAKQTRDAERAAETWKARAESLEPQNAAHVLGGHTRNTSMYRRNLDMSPY